MEQHKNGPIEILQRHIDLNPKMSMVMSIDDSNRVTIDVSHPMDALHMAFLSKFLEIHIADVMKNMLGKI